MNAHSVEVLISINGNPSPTQIGEIKRHLSGIGGVKAVRPSVRSPRLLFIDYDAGTLPVGQILGAVRSSGFDARLVGM